MPHIDWFIWVPLALLANFLLAVGAGTALYRLGRTSRAAELARTEPSPKHYKAIGSPPLDRHYGKTRVGL